MSSPRFAIYFVPQPGSRLATFGAAMLGYDGETGRDVARAKLAGIGEDEAATVTREPGRYGFHATLKAPFALDARRSVGELREAVDAFASSHRPARIGLLAIGALGSFFALKPMGETTTVDKLASKCVEAFDAFRAPLTNDDRQRRLASDLSGRQIELLDRWGYPYVFDQYRFHMTLTGPVPTERQAVWRTALLAAYGDQKRQDVVIDAIVLARQDERAGRFHVIQRSLLKG